MSKRARTIKSDKSPGRKIIVDTTNPAERVATMLRIRRFEEQCVRLAKAGQLHGHYHVYIGQEATAVAACAALTPEDFIFSTWRNHGHLLARGATPVKMMAEILGKAGGYAGGKSGTLHLAVRELGIPTTSALVGGSLPLAAGAALACKRRGSGVAVAFFGDAGLEEGAFYEAMVVAAVWKVPILFVCENNAIPPEQRKRGQYTSSTLPAARLVDVPLALQVPAEARLAVGDVHAFDDVARRRAEPTAEFHGSSVAYSGTAGRKKSPPAICRGDIPVSALRCHRQASMAQPAGRQTSARRRAPQSAIAPLSPPAGRSALSRHLRTPSAS